MKLQLVQMVLGKGNVLHQKLATMVMSKEQVLNYNLKVGDGEI